MTSTKFTLFIAFGEDIFGNVDQVAAWLTFIPFGKVFASSSLEAPDHTFQQRMGFNNQLHVTILNAVMNHLHIMASTVSTDMGHAWLTVFSSLQQSASESEQPAHGLLSAHRA